MVNESSPFTSFSFDRQVQYFCKAALREDSGLTHKNQQVFIIMNPIDLNLEPPILAVRRLLLVVYHSSISHTLFSPMQQPFHCEIEHKVGLTCWSQGPVTCRVRLDRGGYVPGEAISIWATIANQSKVTIKHTRASLTEVRKGLLVGAPTVHSIVGLLMHV